MSNADKNRIFVFGSNLKGIHRKGAALHAKRHYGAIEGYGVGLQRLAYAIPTKATPYKTLTLGQIELEVDAFLLFAMQNPRLQFNVTQIGCGLAGYKPQEIAPMFNIPPSARTNLWFDIGWAPYLNPGPTNFWKGPL